MRHKSMMWMKRFWAWLIIILMVIQSPLTAAAEMTSEQEITIKSVQDFLKFVDNCSFDTWSQGKTVILQNDISLEGIDFLPVPTFGGTFDGGGHSISGVTIDSKLSQTGIFSIVQENGIVRNLKVSGSYIEESNDCVGGIAGENHGMILNCIFYGILKGGSKIGGIVGENGSDGKVRDCTAEGSIAGKSMTGGIAGNNLGALSGCKNMSGINIESSDPGVNLEKIGTDNDTGFFSIGNLDTINVATDTGGIAGYSSGMIMNCINMGTVGYPQIGYNVGGIVGRSSGYIAACENNAEIFGRKDVGGIAGHAEPYVELKVSERLFQDFHDQLDALSRMVDEAVDEAQTSSKQVSASLNDMGDSIGDATDTVKDLTDTLVDFGDDTIQEIDRAGDILSDVVSMLDNSLDSAENIGDDLSSGFKRLKSAIKALEKAGNLDAGTQKSMKNALEKLDNEFPEIQKGREQMLASFPKLKDSLIQSDDSAVQAALFELSEAAAGMAESMSVLEEGVMELADSMELGGVDRTVTEGIRDMAAECASLEDSFSQIKDGLDAILANGQFDWSAVQSGISEILAGLKQMEVSFEGLEKLLSDIGKLLENLKAAADGLSDGLSDIGSAMGDFADASDGLGDLFSDLYDITTYLDSVDPLQITAPDGLRDQTDTLYDQMKKAGDYADELEGSLSELTDSLADNIRDINSQMRTAFTAFTDTIYQVEDGEENLVSDTSQEDIDKVMNGKIRGCRNFGAVSGSTGVGGVAGTMAIEYELDPEDDKIADKSLIRRREYELKAILQKCSNEGTVTARGNYVGSICGEMRLGLIIDCEGYGDIESESGKYVGGIAGHAAGTIQRSFAKCMLSGKSNVGGIVGSAASGGLNSDGGKITGCYSLAQIVECEEHGGAVAGRGGGEFSENYFVSDTLAGIDRISVAGQAEPISYEDMMAVPEIPNKFGWFTLRFFAEDYMLKSLLFDYGTSFDTDVYPEVPGKDGYYYEWDIKELKNLRFDTDVTAEYIPYQWSLGSVDRREDGRTVIFIEGQFENNAVADVMKTEADAGNAVHHGMGDILEKRELLEVWKASVPEDGNERRNMRYLPTEECIRRGITSDGKIKKLEIYQNTADGWKKLETDEIGSYIVAQMDGNHAELAVVLLTVRWWILLIAGTAVLAGAGALFIMRKKCKKKKQTDKK